MVCELEFGVDSPQPGPSQPAVELRHGDPCLRRRLEGGLGGGGIGSRRDRRDGALEHSTRRLVGPAALEGLQREPRGDQVSSAHGEEPFGDAYVHHGLFLKALLGKLEDDGRLPQIARLCHYVMRTTPGPRFRRSLKAAYQRAEELGIEMPPGDVE